MKILISWPTRGFQFQSFLSCLYMLLALAHSFSSHRNKNLLALADHFHFSFLNYQQKKTPQNEAQTLFVRKQKQQQIPLFVFTTQMLLLSLAHKTKPLQFSQVLSSSHLRNNVTAFIFTLTFSIFVVFFN